MSKHPGLNGLMPLRLRLFLEHRREQATAQVQISRWLGSIGLTPRERTIAQLILEHRSYQDIGRRCKVSPRTVQFHASNIFHKAHVTRRGEFERAASAQGSPRAQREKTGVANGAASTHPALPAPTVKDGHRLSAAPRQR